MAELNYLSGARIDTDKRLFFEAMKSGLGYLGFGRKEPEWGQVALIRLEHLAANVFPGDVMGVDGGVGTEKYFDDKSIVVITDPGDIPAGGDRVFIAAVSKSVDQTTWGNYTEIDEVEIGQMYLDFMGKAWCQINGLSPQYVFNQTETHDYFLFNYSKDMTTRIQILEVNISAWLPALSTPVRLGHGSTIGVVDEILTGAGIMTRQTNISGETIVAGMNPVFDHSAYSDQYYFITTEGGVIIQDNMTLIEDVTTSEERILSFSYTTVSGQTAILKVTSATGALNTLGVHHESFNVESSAPVADNNPPSLKLNYIKDDQIHNSLFDIKGIAQLASSDIEFGRQVLDSADETDLIAKGFVIETFTLQSDNPAEIKYAVTDSGAMSDPIFEALQNGCDSVLITKSLANNVPTDETYRQLFVCYGPKDSTGTACVDPAYAEVDLFNETDYGFDMGTLFYVANKVPIYRAGIVGTEDFKIIL